MKKILLLLIITTLWITYLYVRLSAEKDKEIIGYSIVLKWNLMANSPEWLCRARGGKYFGYSLDFKSRKQETSWMCIDDKKLIK